MSPSKVAMGNVVPGSFSASSTMFGLSSVDVHAAGVATAEDVTAATPEVVFLTEFNRLNSSKAATCSTVINYTFSSTFVAFKV